MMLPVAILAGGLATRLRPITETIPKSLVEVACRPFIYHQLDSLRGQGIDRVVLCLGHLGETIVEAVGSGRQFGLSVSYVFDGVKLLGTGGALKKALPQLGDAFFVLYGDSYLGCSYRAVQSAFEKEGKPALMTVLRNQGKWDTSNVEFADGQLLRYDKHKPSSSMQFIDYGLSVIRSSVLANFDGDSAFDLAEVFTMLSEHKQLSGYEVSERFYEIGSQDGLAEANLFLSQKESK